jgi:hypothetical protein
MKTVSHATSVNFDATTTIVAAVATARASLLSQSDMADATFAR